MNTMKKWFIIIISASVVCLLVLFWRIRSAVNAVKAMVETVDTHLEQGNRYYFQGLYSNAVEEYQRAIELFPANMSAHENLRVALKMADPEAWLVEHPDDENVKKRVFLKYLKDGDVDKARAYALMLSDPEERDRCVRLLDNLTIGKGPAISPDFTGGTSRYDTQNLLMRAIGLFVAKNGRWPESEKEVRDFCETSGKAPSLTDVGRIGQMKVRGEQLTVEYRYRSDGSGTLHTNSFVLTRRQRQGASP